MIAREVNDHINRLATLLYRFAHSRLGIPAKCLSRVRCIQRLGPLLWSPSRQRAFHLSSLARRCDPLSAAGSFLKTEDSEHSVLTGRLAR